MAGHRNPRRSIKAIGDPHQTRLLDLPLPDHRLPTQASRTSLAQQGSDARRIPTPHEHLPGQRTQGHPALRTSGMAGTELRQVPVLHRHQGENEKPAMSHWKVGAQMKRLRLKIAALLMGKEIAEDVRDALYRRAMALERDRATQRARPASPHELFMISSMLQ